MTESQNDKQTARREYLLEQLHGIDFCEFMTDLFTEMCYEIDIMNSEGISSFWSLYDDYHVYCLEDIIPDVLSTIKEKLINGSIVFSDIEGTSIGMLWKELGLDDEILLTMLSGLKDIYPDKDSCIYCYYDDYESRLDFYSDKEQFGKGLGNVFTGADTSWEEMDTDELENWWKAYTNETDRIPCCYLSISSD